MLITFIPFSFNILPVIPVISQEGDHLHIMAVLQLFFKHIFNVFFAPNTKESVISSPVKLYLNDLSSQVVKTLPLDRLTGGRGIGNPPKISGHADIMLNFGLLIYFFKKVLAYNFFPCQRQETPSKQDDTNMFSIFFNPFVFYIYSISIKKCQYKQLFIIRCQGDE